MSFVNSILNFRDSVKEKTLKEYNDAIIAMSYANNKINEIKTKDLMNIETKIEFFTIKKMLIETSMTTYKLLNYVNCISIDEKFDDTLKKRLNDVLEKIKNIERVKLTNYDIEVIEELYKSNQKFLTYIQDNLDEMFSVMYGV